MTIDKAIEILTIFTFASNHTSRNDVNDALSLGIEALKQVKESRFDPSTWEPRTLPDETKD